MSAAYGFHPILGAFVASFDPKQGSKVVCQVPDGAVRSTATSEVSEPFFSFDSVKNYIIPKAPLCNRMVSLRLKNCVLIGHPVNIIGRNYERNFFTFNFVFIFRSFKGSEPYEAAITRLAMMMKALEVQTQLLSNKDNINIIDSVVEQMFQDLNTFSECQIPISLANKVNIKLFPIFVRPPEIYSHQVPISTVRLSKLIDDFWDPTMERIIPHINGINSVRRIADIADVEYDLTKQVIQHLIHYDCLIIIGIVQFSNIYCPTSTVADIATNTTMYRELCAFVYLPAGSQSSYDGVSESTSVALSADNSVNTQQSMRYAAFTRSAAIKLTPVQMFQLFTAFEGGTSVYTWYLEHQDILQDIDVRRFLTFGVTKRLIYRVHSYPVLYSRGATKSLLNIPPSDTVLKRALQERNLETSRANLDILRSVLEKPVLIDSLCTDLRAPRTEVMKLLKGIGDWTIINR